MRAAAFAFDFPYDTAYDLLTAAARRCSRGFHFVKWITGLRSDDFLPAVRIEKLSFPAGQGAASNEPRNLLPPFLARQLHLQERETCLCRNGVVHDSAEAPTDASTLHGGSQARLPVGPCDPEGAAMIDLDLYTRLSSTQVAMVARKTRLGRTRHGFAPRTGPTSEGKMEKPTPEQIAWAGRIMRSIRSKKRAEAARRNGRKGGAPKKPEIKFVQGKFVGITPGDLKDWRRRYPNINLQEELQKAAELLKATSGKTRAPSYRRYIHIRLWNASKSA